MSTRQQQPTSSPNSSNQFSDSDRENSVLTDRTVVFDRAAQERAAQERAAQERALQEKATRDSFQQGYLEGRERAAKDYANLSAQFRPQPDRNGNGTTLGILFGILMTAVIGGSVAASFYFDGRIDALRSETETLNETLEDQDSDLDTNEADGSNPFSNLFQREDAPDRFEPTPSERPAESFPSQVAPEPIPSDPLPDTSDTGSDVSDVEAETGSEIAE